MLSAPKEGQAVMAWYNKKVRHEMPYHGQVGRVLISGRGRPRNHLINFNGQKVIIPAGNIIDAGPKKNIMIEHAQDQYNLILIGE